MKAIFIFIGLLFFSHLTIAQAPPLSQYPSPMQDNVRQHWRVPSIDFSGTTVQIENLLSRPVDIYIPAKAEKSGSPDLLIQFFGTKEIVAYAADRYRGRLIAATVNLGSGSSVYATPFSDTLLFQRLVDSIQQRVRRQTGHSLEFKKIIVSGFSAGYGAVRAILTTPSNRNIINGVLLLDGLHASYIPDRKVLAEGGRIDSSAYTGIIQFCNEAVQARSAKKFLFTHSEIFPGTFVSTTESADFLIKTLALKSQAVLKWGPGGMQQISRSRKNHFQIVGFAGNTAPDHMDHLHNLYYFLNMLERL